MNIKLNKFNTLFALLALLSIGSLSASKFKLGKVTVDQTVSKKKITVDGDDPTFADLYAVLVKDNNLKSVLLDNSDNKYSDLYYLGKSYATNADVKLTALEIQADQDIKLTTAAPIKPKAPKKTKTDTPDTNNNNNGSDDDKKGLWKNHKKKILGTAGVGTILLVGGAAYFMLNSGEGSKTEKA